MRNLADKLKRAAVVCLSAPKVQPARERMRKQILQDAFNAIRDPRDAAMKRAFIAICSFENWQKQRAFFIWKFGALSDKIRKSDKDMLHQELRKHSLLKLRLIGKGGIKGAFLMWKDKANQDKCRDNIANVTSNIMKVPEKLMPAARKVCLPSLRHAFDRLKAKNPIPAHLKRALGRLRNVHDRDLARGFFSWKYNTLGNTMTDKVKSLNKDSHAVNLAGKLEEVSRKRRRAALQSANKNKIHKDKQFSQVKCMRILLRKGLQVWFNTWKNKTDEKKQKDTLAEAANQMNNPILRQLKDRIIRRPLKEAFDRIKANPMPKKVKSAVRNLQNCRDRETKHGFFRWKLAVITQRLKQSMDTIAKNPHIIEGVNKLNAAKNRKPRDALRMLSKNLNKQNKLDDVVKKLRIVFSKGLAGRFYHWRDVNDSEKKSE